MTAPGASGRSARKRCFQCGEQAESRIDLCGGKSVGGLQIAYLKRHVACPCRLRKRRQAATRPDPETRSVGRGAERAKRTDADIGWQITCLLLQLLAQKRTHRRILNRALRQVTRAQEVCRTRVVAFFGRHRSNRREMLHDAGNLWQVFSDPNSRNTGVDGFGRTAIGLALFRVKCFHLTRPAGHPQQNTRSR